MPFLRDLAGATTLLALAALHSTACAQTVDQADLVNDTAMATFEQSDLAQSFTPQANVSAGAGIFLNAGSNASGDITIQLWNALPNQGGAAELASGTSSGTAGNWVDVFWSPVFLVPNATYYLVFTSTNQDLAIAGDITNQYAGGNVFANSGYGDFAEFDYTFQEFSAAAAVPEPASLTLLGAGLMATAAAAALWRNRAAPGAAA